jgi:hypothetical protein
MFRPATSHADIGNEAAINLQARLTERDKSCRPFP